MAVALKKGGVKDAQVYYQYFKTAEEMGIVRKTVNTTTQKTWVEMVDEQLPF